VKQKSVSLVAVGQKVPYISHSSVVTHLRCGGIFNDYLITSLLLILAVNNFQNRSVFGKVTTNYCSTDHYINICYLSSTQLIFALYMSHFIKNHNNKQKYKSCANTFTENILPSYRMQHRQEQILLEVPALLVHKSMLDYNLPARPSPARKVGCKKVARHQVLLLAA